MAADALQRLARLFDKRDAGFDLVRGFLTAGLEISLAALAERWASSRTSWATTAKPLPDSPARAASTPALSARRLVWKAISSMTEMIVLICCDEPWIASIALIVLP